MPNRLARERLTAIRESICRYRKGSDDDSNGGREFNYKKADADDGTNSGTVGGLGGVVYTFEFNVDLLDDPALLARFFEISPRYSRPSSPGARTARLVCAGRSTDLRSLLSAEMGA